MADRDAELLVRDADVDYILSESGLGLSDFPINEELAAKLMRACYAKGYDRALRSAEPLDIAAATDIERESHARLPIDL